MKVDEALVPLSQLCERTRSICYGIVQPGQASIGGVPIVRVNNFDGNRLELGDPLQVHPDVEAKYRRSRLCANDVLISLVGSVGQVALVPAKAVGWNIARAVGLVPAIDQHHARWIYYALQTQSARDYILGRANTTVQVTFNLKDLSSFPIPYPDRKVRENIIYVLSSLDDKIKLNRQMNETLEAMAQAIFRDWFVDFGPTRRKLEGATDAVEIMGGLVTDVERAQQIADLFPSSLDDNGLPAGWVEVPVSELVNFNPKEPLRKGILAPYTEMSALPTSGPTADLPVQREFGSGMRFRNSDALLARITPCLENGKAAFVDFLEDGQVGWGSTEFIVLRAKKLVPAAYSYLLARLPEFKATAVASMTGTSGRQRAQADTLEAFPVTKPSEAVFAAFGQIIDPMFEKISANAAESRTLAATRDLLMPKLMAGEVELRDAEEQLEAAQ